MPVKDPRLYLMHIRECCERVLNYTAGLGPKWSDVPVVLDAVCRNLEILGEAAAKLDKEWLADEPEAEYETPDVENAIPACTKRKPVSDRTLCRMTYQSA